MKLRPYQSKAVDWLASRQRGLVQSPAGSGKTIMGAAAVSERLATGSVIVIANTTDQIRQWADAFDRFDLRKRLKIDFCCGVSNLDTSGYDCMIIDEAHHVTADRWWEKASKQNGILWGFSATPWTGDEERDERTRILFGLTYIVHRDQLVDEGHVSPALVKYLDGTDPDAGGRIEEEAEFLIEKRRRKYPFLWSTPKGKQEQENRCIWQACSQIGLCDNRLRDHDIMKTASYEAKQGNSVLILTATIEHGKELAARLGAKCVNSKLPKRKRESIIDEFKSGTLPILVATSLADEGLDCPIASVLILANAGRSPNKIIQRTGRVLRPYPGKEYGIIYDFKDEFHYMLRAQSKARQRQYKKLKYQIL